MDQTEVMHLRRLRMPMVRTRTLLQLQLVDTIRGDHNDKTLVIVRIKTQAINTKIRAISTKTQAASTKTKGINTRTQAINIKTISATDSILRPPQVSILEIHPPVK